jgi:hypothetical protein
VRILTGTVAKGVLLLSVAAAGMVVVVLALLREVNDTATQSHLDRCLRLEVGYHAGRNMRELATTREGASPSIGSSFEHRISYGGYIISSKQTPSRASPAPDQRSTYHFMSKQSSPSPFRITRQRVRLRHNEPTSTPKCPTTHSPPTAFAVDSYTYLQSGIPAFAQKSRSTSQGAWCTS